MTEPDAPVKTTRTSLRLLETIRDRDGGTVGELAEELGMARSTAHNHLRTLFEAGYLVKEGNQYHVGLRLFSLGEYARTRKPEYELAKEAVEDLATRTQMEADFNVEEHGRLINVFGTIGHAGEPGIQLGNRFHLHSTSAGKAILAELPRSRVEELLETHGLPKTAPNTITERDELLADLEATRERGYATNDEELFTGYKSIGKAVTLPDGRVLGGLAVGGPTYIIGSDFDQSVYDTLAQTVVELENDIASTLFGQ